jgi:hypothetical protein
MAEYETPTIVELGSVAEFTRGDDFGFDYDSQTWYGRLGFGSGTS